jgi:hypothetical protein
VIFLLFYSPLFFTVDIFPHSIVYSSPLEKKVSLLSLILNTPKKPCGYKEEEEKRFFFFFFLDC